MATNFHHYCLQLKYCINTYFKLVLSKTLKPPKMLMYEHEGRKQHLQNIPADNDLLDPWFSRDFQGSGKHS